MIVSVIVPIYKGVKYIDKINNMISNNADEIKSNKEDIDIELIFVNDYPNEQICVNPVSEQPNLSIKVIINSKNEGIHQSRVNGIKQSKGEYILMLDQDDLITNNCVRSQVKHIGKADIVIGNGYKMFGTKKKIIYRDVKKQKLATKEKNYLFAANQIVSPGHCLIRKDAIPKEWCEYIIKDNGGDDLFLWLLMFETGCKFSINTNEIYTHVDTGENLSLDLNRMYKSADNVIEMAVISKGISHHTISLYKRRINFLRKMQSGSMWDKLLACARNIDICIFKAYAYFR